MMNKFKKIDEERKQIKMTESFSIELKSLKKKKKLNIHPRTEQEKL